MIELVSEIDILELLSILTKSYLSFYFVLSVYKYEVSAFRLLISSFIIAAFMQLRAKLNSPTLLLDGIVITVAILLVKREFSFKEFVKISALYGLITLLAKSFESLLIDFIEPNENLLSMIVCTSILLSVFVLKVVLKLVANAKPHRLVYSVELISGSATLKTKAFWDSGNQLYFKGQPVIMVSAEVANKLKLKNTLKIPVSTVGGRSILDGGELCIKIFSDKKSHKLLEVRYCISDTIVSRGYDVLLHKEMEVV